MTATLDEHRGYIGDVVRMERFRRAIAEAVRPGDVVVDLGCGFGVLGLMCLRHGAARVWGIDHSDAIEIARETAARSGFADRYRCLSSPSFRAELPERVDVIICDHVGYFGIDYGIVAVLADARRRMLKPGGRVIPGKLVLQVAGVVSDLCRRRTDEWGAPQIPVEFRWLAELGANTKRGVSFAAQDIVTDPVPLLTIDLAAESNDFLSGEAELIADKCGALDGIAGWFDCAIVPGVAMTNSPVALDRIDRDQAFFPFSEPLAVEPGDRIRVVLTLRHDSDIYGWKARNLRTGERRSHSTVRSRILGMDALSRKDDRVVQIGPLTQAARIVAGYVDGQRTFHEIEEAVICNHPALMPSETELRRFVQGELARLGR